LSFRDGVCISTNPNPEGLSRTSKSSINFH